MKPRHIRRLLREHFISPLVLSRVEDGERFSFGFGDPEEAASVKEASLVSLILELALAEAERREAISDTERGAA